MARNGYAQTNQLGWPAPDHAAFRSVVDSMQDAVGSQNDLALLLGVDYETVGAWRNGRAFPRGPAVCRMIREFPMLTHRLVWALAPGDAPGAVAIRLGTDLSRIAERALPDLPVGEPRSDR